MFVIEKMLDDHARSVEAWEKARQDYIDSRDYYSRGEYEERHPRPGSWVKVLVKSVSIGVCVALMGILVVGFANEIAKDNKNHPHKAQSSTSQKKEEKKPIAVGDKVQVVYGDFKDSVGVVIKQDGSSAIIKLTNSTFTRAMAAANGNNSSYGQDNGTLLKIGSLDNLVPYKEVK